MAKAVAGRHEREAHVIPGGQVAMPNLALGLTVSKGCPIKSVIIPASFALENRCSHERRRRRGEAAGPTTVQQEKKKERKAGLDHRSASQFDLSPHLTPHRSGHSLWPVLGSEHKGEMKIATCLKIEI